MDLIPRSNEVINLWSLRGNIISCNKFWEFHFQYLKTPAKVLLYVYSEVLKNSNIIIFFFTFFVESDMEKSVYWSKGETAVGCYYLAAAVVVVDSMLTAATTLAPVGGWW